MSDFIKEDFYRAAPDNTVRDGYGKTVLTCADEAEAERLACALNIAFARGALRAFTVVFTPEQLAEAGVV